MFPQARCQSRTVPEREAAPALLRERIATNPCTRRHGLGHARNPRPERARPDPGNVPARGACGVAERYSLPLAGLFAGLRYHQRVGLPAFLQPDNHEPALSRLPAEVERACSEFWRTAQMAWAARPAEDSDAEIVALQATFDLFLELAPAFPDQAPVLRAYVNEGLRRIVERERATAEADRAFALRQVEQALDHYAVALEAFSVLDDVYTEATLAAEDVKGPMPYELRPLYRAQGALLMAFETMDQEPAEDFRYWARQALEKWRRVVAQLPTLTNLMTGARAQVRARLAWTSWTDDDRAVEQEAWKTLLPR